MDIEVAKVFAATICITAGTIAPAIAEGMLANKTMEAISRNPSLENSLFPKMIIAMAVCESIAIFALIVALIILFV